MEAVDDEAGEREATLPQRPAKPDRFVDRLALGRGDEHERRPGRAQQLLDVLSASWKLSVMSPSSAKKPVTSAIASTPVTAAAPQERRGPDAQHPHPEPGRSEQDLQHPSLQERGQPARRLQEVERVARGRRVKHHQIELALVG